MKRLLSFFIILSLAIAGCSEDDETPNVSSTLQINGKVFQMIDGFTQNFGRANENSASDYEGFKHTLEIYSQGLSYDKDDGFSGNGYVLAIQLFSREGSISEGAYTFSRNQTTNTFDNCNIIEYKENGSPSGLSISDYGEINIYVENNRQFILTGTCVVGGNEVRFSYAGALRSYPQ